MTVRMAELCMAVTMTIFSVYLMYKSAELPIGWIEGEGPGGGFWPFWLAAVMLLSCGGILFNWVKRKTAVAASEETYIERGVMWDVGLVAGSLIITVALFHWIGVYGALPLFLLFYLKFMGRHGWPLSVGLAITIPVVTFLFFEIMLKITLPKGITEELFYPIYPLFF
ncbi:MAG: tripartite tricarboxylate transporter TctB family protein [Alphaproteobacteria bacterium]|nr:tripartite tricarboxylate transporter TctB family protein [Alphaproteobacteria bacterium]